MRQEAAAAAKARAKAAQQEMMEQEKALDLSKRLEKIWKHSDSLALRAEDEYEKHLLIMHPQRDGPGGPPKLIKPRSMPEFAPTAEEQVEPQEDRGKHARCTIKFDMTSCRSGSGNSS